MKERKAKRQHKEIRKGATAIGDVLLKALNRVNQNIDSYDKALAREERSLGLNFGTIAKVAGRRAPNYCAGGNMHACAYQAQQADQARQSTVRYGALNRFAGIGGAHGYVAAHHAANVAGGVGAMADQMSGQDQQPAEQAAAPAPLTEEELAAQAMLPGLQKAGMSSQKYMELTEAVRKRAELQRLLELNVTPEPWTVEPVEEPAVEEVADVAPAAEQTADDAAEAMADTAAVTAEEVVEAVETEETAVEADTAAPAEADAMTKPEIIDEMATPAAGSE